MLRKRSVMEGGPWSWQTASAQEAEHAPRLHVVDKEETVGFPRCLLIQPVQLLLGSRALSSSMTASSSCWLRSLQQQRNCMFTRRLR